MKMEIEKLFKNSWEIFQKNIVAFIVAALIADIGSIFIVTIAPLFYGIIYMAAKGAKREIVEINDVFRGFESKNFIQSWIVLCVSLAEIILLIILYVLMTVASLWNIEFILVSIAPASWLVIVILGVVQIVVLVYAMPLLVIRGYRGKDALKETVKLIQNDPTDAIILFLVVSILNLIGFLIGYSFLNVGLLLTIPISMIICVLAVQNLVSEKTTK